MNTVDVIERIVRAHPEIKHIQLVSYKAAKDLASDYQQTWTAEDEKSYKEALEIRQTYKLPFWHALMLEISNSKDDQMPLNCLVGTCRHHDICNLAILGRNEIGSLESFQKLTVRTGINSRVILENGTIRHIPMLDFHISYSDRNTIAVKEVCKLLGYHGFVLSSGRSYHFIGNTLITKSEMISFLGRALLFTPIVDTVWIAHQLQDQACTLRISGKYGVYPEVISKV